MILPVKSLDITKFGNVYNIGLCEEYNLPISNLQCTSGISWTIRLDSSITSVGQIQIMFHKKRHSDWMFSLKETLVLDVNIFNLLLYTGKSMSIPIVMEIPDRSRMHTVNDEFEDFYVWKSIFPCIHAARIHCKCYFFKAKLLIIDASFWLLFIQCPRLNCWIGLHRLNLFKIQWKFK